MSAATIDSKQANIDWRQLGAPTRREVLARARAGEGHPDPAVAKVAVRWGRAQAALPMKTRLARTALGAVLGAYLAYMINRLLVPDIADSLIQYLSAVVVVIGGTLFFIWWQPKQFRRVAAANERVKS